jgi:hypothetical protein
LVKEGGFESTEIAIQSSYREQIARHCSVTARAKQKQQLYSQSAFEQNNPTLEE